MELALIAIIVSACVLVLQVITLVIVAGMRASIRGGAAAPKISPTPAPAERFERRDGNFRRHDRRPFQEQRPRQQQSPSAPVQQSPSAPVQQSPSADPVEKSLRDINLRLKNAERDQEFARRRLQENLGRGERLHQRGPDGGDRDGRGNRDRNRDHRNRHRDHRRGNWQDRNQQPSAPQPSPSNDVPRFEKRGPSPSPEINVPLQQQPSAPATAGPDLELTDFVSEEALQHGRKIIVKRRPLGNEPSGAEGNNGQTEAAGVGSSPQPIGAVGASNPEEETAISAPAGGEAEIEFGRRKDL